MRKYKVGDILKNKEGDLFVIIELDVEDREGELGATIMPLNFDQDGPYDEAYSILDEYYEHVNHLDNNIINQVKKIVME